MGPGTVKHQAIGLSVVVIVVFPDHTHLLLLIRCAQGTRRECYDALSISNVKISSYQSMNTYANFKKYF